MVSNIFYFHPYLGKCSNLTNIFQLGWNHQLEKNIKGSDELRAIHPIFNQRILVWMAEFPSSLKFKAQLLFGENCCQRILLLFEPPTKKTRVLIGKRLSFGGFNALKLQNRMQTGSRLISPIVWTSLLGHRLKNMSIKNFLEISWNMAVQWMFFILWIQWINCDPLRGALLLLS